MLQDRNTNKTTLTPYSRAVLGDETNRLRQASFDKLTNGMGRAPSSGIKSAGTVEIMSVRRGQGIAQGNRFDLLCVSNMHSTGREARGQDVADLPLTASTSTASASATAFVSSPSASPSRSLATRHRASSSTSSIPNFQHPVHLPSSGYIRSQPLGVTSKASTRAALAEQGEYAPTLSGGMASHRLSVSSSSSSLGSEDVLDDEDEAGPSRVHDPRKYESDSEVVLRSSASGQAWDRWKHDLEDLPPNPKLWLPSHLSLYLSAHLSLHPLLSKDITEFIRKSRLSGRTFLRLRDEDMEEMGINLRWRRALSDAREVLKKEASNGRLFWGFEGGAAPVAVKDSDGGNKSVSGAALNRDLDGAHILLGLSTSVRSASSALSASTARTRRLAGSSSGSSGSGSTCDSRPPSVGSGMPYLRSQSPPQSHASGTTARSYAPPLLRHNSSSASSCALEVEGQNQLEDDLIKEEWKQSWKRLLNYSASSNGGKGAHRGSRVRGMASVFEKVDEGSREGSPVKSRSGGSPKVTRREKKGPKRDAPVQKESRCRNSAREARGHGMQDSIDSNASNASVDEGTYVQQLQRSRNVHTEFHVPSRKTSRTMGKADEGGYPTARPLPTRTASMRASAIDVFSMGSALPLDSEFDRTNLGTSLKRVPSPISTANATEVKTIRGPFASTSSANPHPHERVPSNPPTTRSGSRMSKEEKRRSLATLFDLEIPRVSTISTSTSSMTRRSTIVGADGADDLVEWEIGATQGKRGSMVLVKRSQLEAVARRMDEIEEALAASIHGGSEAAVSIAGDLPDPIRTLQSRTSSNAREEQDTTTALEALTQRLASLENRLLPAPAHHPLAQQQHHAHACHGYGSPSSPSMYESSPQATARVDAAMSSWVAHQLTLNEIEASRQARANALDRQHRDRMDAASLDNSARSREASHDIMAYRRDGEDGPKVGRAGDPGMGPGGPLSWSSLGGYVVAASIGIGIVAGEVVAAKLFNVRAGHH
ncbi:BZ3500_MvSof-1268-A1-R1_Chr2-2g04744 [Microbotryum saponariae]|uniref:BZ3500_MvSof-1268-A1-R1_Chr2-2g04744 protein n=1 Tax=Microbotryum saponariae TaxID=289078 RepID=A0A2X0K7N7_9BASI|nr:BZ3500_MvSof-1268-A1-R1_Chr2-2g04744 [Microbotryum saponariae]SDA00056.1 BZ3501_MvSof-1269-A2-R1_Chr2-2g04418 [Microbotryum saponariae]